MMEKMISKGIANINVQDEEIRATMREMIKSEIKKHKYPSFEQMANECGLGNHFAFFYHMLSSMSHGNFMSIGERHKTLEFSCDQDERNISSFIIIAELVQDDCYGLCREWIVNGNLHPIFEFPTKNTLELRESGKAEIVKKKALK